MLHAFWAGRYHSGDNPATGNVSTPQVEAGWFEDTRTDLNPGDELLGVYSLQFASPS